jgi:hypothetical protein
MKLITRIIIIIIIIIIIAIIVVIPWRIRLSGLFQSRINSEIMNPTDSI